MKPIVQFVVAGLIWAGLAGYSYWKGAQTRAYVFTGLSAFFLLAAAIPPFGRRLHVVFHALVNAIVNGIAMALLTLIYYLFITPAGLLLRATRALHTTKRPDRSLPTYWIPRKPESITPERYQRTF